MWFVGSFPGIRFRGHTPSWTATQVVSRPCGVAMGTPSSLIGGVNLDSSFLVLTSLSYYSYLLWLLVFLFQSVAVGERHLETLQLSSHQAAPRFHTHCTRWPQTRAVLGPHF